MAFETDVKVAQGVADITEDGQGKYKPRGNQVFGENIKNEKIKNKRHGNQKFATCIKKVKIKCLHVVLKRCEAAYHREDCFDGIQESFSILFIIIILYVLNTLHVF